MTDPVARTELAREIVEFMENEEVINVPVLVGNIVVGVGPTVADYILTPGCGYPSGFESIKLK